MAGLSSQQKSPPVKTMAGLNTVPEQLFSSSENVH